MTKAEKIKKLRKIAKNLPYGETVYYYNYDRKEFRTAQLVGFDAHHILDGCDGIICKYILVDRIQCCDVEVEVYENYVFFTKGEAMRYMMKNCALPLKDELINSDEEGLQ